VCLGSVLFFGSTAQRNALNLSLSTKITTNMMLAHIPTTLERAQDAPGDADIRDNEIDYTWYWLKLAIRWQ
jgi:hypothetical protein